MLSMLTKSQRIERLAEKLPTVLAEELLALPEKLISSDAYYSRGRLAATTVTVGSGTHTMVVPAQTISLFTYAIGESMANVGFPNADPYLHATRGDTNLLRAGSTNNSEVFGIENVSIVFASKTDARLLAELAEHVHVSFSISGNQRARSLGPLQLLGARGGISGAGETNWKTPNLRDARSVIPGFVQNGSPHETNVFDLEEVIPWGPQSVQGIPHMLSLDIELTRSITLVGTARAADAANGVAAFTPPAAQTAVSDVDSTYLGFTAYLGGLRMGGVSVRL